MLQHQEAGATEDSLLGQDLKNKKSSISWAVEMEDVLMDKRSNEGPKTLADVETKGLKGS